MKGVTLNDFLGIALGVLNMKSVELQYMILGKSNKGQNEKKS